MIPSAMPIPQPVARTDGRMLGRLAWTEDPNSIPLRAIPIISRPGLSRSGPRSPNEVAPQ